jgi:hypothetical protein
MSTCQDDEDIAAAMGPAKGHTQAKKVWEKPTLSYLSVGRLSVGRYHPLLLAGASQQNTEHTWRDRRCCAVLCCAVPCRAVV